VLGLRHTPKERALRKVLPWLAAERPDLYNAFQQTQGSVRVENDLAKARYVASFIGWDSAKQDSHSALFVGLYQVGEHRPLTRKQFWDVPAYQELMKYGMLGMGEDSRPSILWFDMENMDFYEEWQGKLIVDWPPPPIRWWRWADQASFEVLAVLEDSALQQAMPDWRECVVSWKELRILPRIWRETLRHWRGIYYIFDCSDGKGYVGSAYGDENLLGRWQHGYASGHGGNIHLLERNPENFFFSILERVSPDMDWEDVIALESTWKERLHTRWPEGLNDN
jgi:hypothetical protein